jgi:hypothetical protein
MINLVKWSIHNALGIVKEAGSKWF